MHYSTWIKETKYFSVCKFKNCYQKQDWKDYYQTVELFYNPN